MVRGVLSSVLEVVGLLAVIAGAALFDWRAGVVVAGVVLVVVAWLLDRPQPAPRTPVVAPGEVVR